jgi:hypothetical protein
MRAMPFGRAFPCDCKDVVWQPTAPAGRAFGARGTVARPPLGLDALAATSFGCAWRSTRGGPLGTVPAAW